MIPTVLISIIVILMKIVRRLILINVNMKNCMKHILSKLFKWPLNINSDTELCRLSTIQQNIPYFTSRSNNKYI